MFALILISELSFASINLFVLMMLMSFVFIAIELRDVEASALPFALMTDAVA